MRGFLILFSILAGLLGWLFYAAPSAQVAGSSPSFVISITQPHPERNTP